MMGTRKNDRPGLILTKDFLLEHYVRLGKTTTQISNEIGISNHSTVRNALIRHGIPRRKSGHTPGRRWSAGNSKYVGEMSGSYFYGIKKGAESRGFEFLITAEQAWDAFVSQGGRCALSGCEIEFAPYQSWKGPRPTASLDRIDSKRGYVFENIQWVHKTLNAMKMDLEEGEFVEWCRMVVQHHDASQGQNGRVGHDHGPGGKKAVGQRDDLLLR